MSKAVKGGLTDGDVRDLEYKLARALSDKLRIEILEVLGMRSAAAVDLVPILGATKERISYHMNVLYGLELIEQVEVIPVRGATKKVYKSVVEMFLDDAMWAELAPQTKALFSEAGIRSIVDRAERAIHAKTFDSRPDRHMAGVTLKLDEEAWTEVAAFLLENLETFKRLADESNDRVRAKKRDTRFNVTLAQLLFESPPPRNSDTIPPPDR